MPASSDFRKVFWCCLMFLNLPYSSSGSCSPESFSSLESQDYDFVDFLGCSAVFLAKCMEVPHYPQINSSFISCYQVFGAVLGARAEHQSHASGHATASRKTCAKQSSTLIMLLICSELRDSIHSPLVCSVYGTSPSHNSCCTHRSRVNTEQSCT